MHFEIKKYITPLFKKVYTGGPFRFAIFFILYLLARYLFSFFEITEFGHNILSPLHERLSIVITKICCYILQPIYPDIHTKIDHTIVISGNSTIQMQPGCTGLNHMIYLSFTLLFYPLALINKVQVFIPSLLIIFFASIVHFLFLIPIANNFNEFYGFAHKYISRILFFSFIFLCWLIWERLRTQRRELKNKV